MESDTTTPGTAAAADGLRTEVVIDPVRPLADLTAALTAVCDRIEDSARRTVVVLRLRPSPPGSRAWPEPTATVQQVSRWERTLRRLEGLGTMNIAVAGGTCGGPTLDVLLTADFRIAAPDLELLPPINDGHFWPGMALHRLVQHLGTARARQIVMWGDDIPAARARALGLIDQITEDMDAALHTSSVLMGRISDAELAVRRRLLQEGASVSYEEALGSHLAACSRELLRLQANGTGAIAGHAAEGGPVR